ncbi:MAG TPA: hypothetical protein VF020_11930 [Chthoniobacterales bacterium]
MSTALNNNSTRSILPGTAAISDAYQLPCGLFQLVCTNGMVVSDGTFQRILIKLFGFNPT